MSKIIEWLKNLFGIGIDSMKGLWTKPSSNNSGGIMPAFNPDKILQDTLFPYDSSIDVNSFLKSKNSALLTAKTASGTVLGDAIVDIIETACEKSNVNPKLILVSLQREQSLITGYKTIPQRVLDRALGYGCEDDGDKPEYYGFSIQIGKGAETYRKWFDYALKVKAGTSLVVDDNRTKVTPANQFTFALYRYTPHIGWAKSPRHKAMGNYGNYNTWLIWKAYWPKDIA